MKNLTVTHTGALAVSAPTTPLLPHLRVPSPGRGPGGCVVLAAVPFHPSDATHHRTPPRRILDVDAPEHGAPRACPQCSHPTHIQYVPRAQQPLCSGLATDAHVASRRGGGGGDDPSSSDGRGSSDSSSGASASSLSSRSRRSLRVHAARRVVSCGSNASAV